MENCQRSSNSDVLSDKIQQELALDFNIVSLDFAQDWLNGALYMPLWYWRKRKKKSYLFGLFKSSAKNQFCDCDEEFPNLKSFVSCSFRYKQDTDDLTIDSRMAEEEDKWHKSVTTRVWYRNGVIKHVENDDGLDVYYYSAANATNDNPKMPISKRNRFFAVRLYATDIILLGSLNDYDTDGIPQLFKYLPSTTSNVPPIATITEPISLDDEGKNDEQTDYQDKPDEGVVNTTRNGLGLQW